MYLYEKTITISPNMKNTLCNHQRFQAVFKEQAKPLYNFMYYRTGNAAKAEDLVQEAFVKLWNNCAKVAIEKAKSFLFTVGNNLFLDGVKHEKVVLKFQQLAINTNTNQSPEYLMEEKEFQARLEQAIQELTEKQRTVFLLNRIDKMTYKEIAAHLEVSVKAVEKLMHKALIKLRKLSTKI